MNIGTVDSFGARLKAKKNSFQAKMIEMKTVATSPGVTIGKHDLGHLAEEPGAVDPRRVEHVARDLLEEGAQHPDRDRQVHRGVEDDQPLHRAEQVEPVGEELGVAARAEDDVERAR